MFKLFFYIRSVYYTQVYIVSANFLKIFLVKIIFVSQNTYNLHYEIKIYSLRSMYINHICYSSIEYEQMRFNKVQYYYDRLG